jgi:hypothetical protein
MKRLACLFTVSVAWIAPQASAQVPLPPQVRFAQHLAPLSSAVPAPPAPSPGDRPTNLELGELTPTPSMWFYEQARKQYSDPKAAVRANAEFRAAQRMRRLAAQQWYGYSNLRPTVSPTPMTTAYAPHWSGNVWGEPNRWSGTPRHTVVVLPEPPGSYGLR